MEAYEIFKDLAIIIVAAKIMGIVAQMFRAPQVAGEIIAGLLLGPSVLGLVQPSEFLNEMASIGVLILMFLAGLETDIKDLLKTGPKAFLIACCGVLFPLIGGFALNSAFYGAGAPGSETFIKNIFVGVILTATSVSITVETLREMGRLKGEIGTTILSAAIMDDVIGIIVLTFVVGMKNPETKPVSVIINTLLFFLFCGVVGFLCYKLFKALDVRYEHHRRIPILGLVMCFAFAYIAEHFFGIADITGAYVAGVVLCSIRDAKYIARKMDISSYMIFGPIFFVSIGLKTDISGFTKDILLFCVCFVLVGLVTKIIGCGLMAKLCRFRTSDAFKIGIGMMTRGEVALIVAQKGLAVGLMDSKFFMAVILLIIISSVMTPVILKILYSKHPTGEGYDLSNA